MKKIGILVFIILCMFLVGCEREISKIVIETEEKTIIADGINEVCIKTEMYNLEGKLVEGYLPKYYANQKLLDGSIFTATKGGIYKITARYENVESNEIVINAESPIKLFSDKLVVKLQDADNRFNFSVKLLNLRTKLNLSNVKYFVDDKVIEGTYFTPKKIGKYEVYAKCGNAETETITLEVVDAGVKNNTFIFEDWSWISSRGVIDDKTDIIMGDVNGDGKDDFVAKGQPGQWNAGWVYLGLSDGKGFEDFTWISNKRLVADKARMCLGDVNGDGKADLVYVGEPQAEDAGWVYIALSTGKGFENWSWISKKKIIDDLSEIYLGDVNGDGKADLITKGDLNSSKAGHIFIGLSKGTEFEEWTNITEGRFVDDQSKIRIGDVNGDGKADLVSVGAPGAFNAGQVYIGLSKGESFEGWTWHSTDSRIDDFSDIYLGDINGDKKADLITKRQYGKDDAGWIYYGLSTGTQFEGWTGNSGKRLVDDYVNWSTDWNTTWKAKVSLGDVNGDGKDDLVTIGEHQIPRLEDEGYIKVGLCR